MTKVNKEIHLFNTSDQMAAFAIQQWATLAKEQVKKKKYFSAALSGGTTPVTLYQKLSGHNALPWGKTHIFIVDERFVPYESDENNYHMINRTLLRHVNVMPKNVHPILTSESSPQNSADRYEEDIISYCKNVKVKVLRIDLIILGIGEDGHTASLFPGTPALSEVRRFAVPVTPSGMTKRERITITFPVINNAATVMFLATGKNKASVIQEVVEDKYSTLPAARVKPRNGQLIFLLDDAAGSLLRGKKK